MKPFNMLKALLLLMFGSLFILTTSCQREERESVAVYDNPSDYGYEIPQSWNYLFLETERFTRGYGGPIAARALAYINLAAFEAVQPGMEALYNSFDGYFPGLEIPEPVPSERYHWPTVLNAAYARSATHFYPHAPAAQLFAVFNLEEEINQKYRSTLSSTLSEVVFQRSVEYGRQVADAVFKWSASDPFGHQAYLRTTDPTYVPPTGYGKWQPTFPDYSPAALPRWGNVRTFAADASDTAPDPLPISAEPQSVVFKQAVEVQELVNKIKTGADYEARWIADFWSDDCPILTFTPPNRWIAIASQIIQLKKTNLPETLETYARVSLALSDAGVRAWHEKYRFNVERPVDFIRRELHDPTWNTIMCPDGSGQYFTPNFPAYPSGHAAFSAAAAEVLTALFGKIQFTDTCHEGRTEFIGTPRTFENFYQAAEENALSRIPLGVHFEMDATAGLELGYKVGRKINKLPWRK